MGASYVWQQQRAVPTPNHPLGQPVLSSLNILHIHLLSRTWWPGHGFYNILSPHSTVYLLSYSSSFNTDYVFIVALLLVTWVSYK